MTDSWNIMIACSDFSWLIFRYINAINALFSLFSFRVRKMRNTVLYPKTKPVLQSLLTSACVLANICCYSVSGEVFIVYVTSTLQLACTKIINIDPRTTDGFIHCVQFYISESPKEMCHSHTNR